MKTCTACQQEKPLTGFSRDKRRGHAARCKDCRKAEVTAWRTKNRESYNASERQRYAESPAKWERHLRSKYGISLAEYAERLAAQGGCCAICRASGDALRETLAVDHDHATGAVRGLLCAKCNRMLGCAVDRPEVLRAGAEYLINAEAARVWIEAVMEAA
ncbi:endonuclease VII domain-containing protein [Massilia violaceinigra]|uniref:Endonuclease VII domain-containing protein n=1 Tax=Massilia violaceinigra TaxID=2045208 RepID=A0ABY4A5D6_9BURK|nr:endonuclease VII domain-containing protein [Massilia violaceinigra]UOD28766.1 endonuclease VII domain-containing protein [Massilia violaceinigra]